MAVPFPPQVPWAPRVSVGRSLWLASAVLLSLPFSTANLSQLQALNRELGKLCGSPPREALAVCRIHARLVQAI